MRKMLSVFICLSITQVATAQEDEDVQPNEDQSSEPNEDWGVKPNEDWGVKPNEDWGVKRNEDWGVRRDEDRGAEPDQGQDKPDEMRNGNDRDEAPPASTRRGQQVVEGSKSKQPAREELTPTPDTYPGRFEPMSGRKGKIDKETGEVWEKDLLHKDHFEVYRNKKDYENGRRDRSVWNDGRPKEKFKR